MATREKAEENQTGSPTGGFPTVTVTDPISMADLENIHTRKGKYPSRPPLTGPKTWGVGPKGKGGKGAQRKKGKTSEHSFRDDLH